MCSFTLRISSHSVSSFRLTTLKLVPPTNVKFALVVHIRPTQQVLLSHKGLIIGTAKRADFWFEHLTPLLLSVPPFSSSLLWLAAGVNISISFLLTYSIKRYLKQILALTWRRRALEKDVRDKIDYIIDINIYRAIRIGGVMYRNRGRTV